MSEVKKRMIAVYDKLIYFNEASKYTILRMRTDDPSVPEEARSQYTFRDRMLRFTAVGYGLPQTDSVKLEIEGDWKEGKYGLQLHVEHWHELVPPTTEGLLSYLSSGLLKGIGESTARSIVQRFGTDTLDVLEYHPEKLLEIRGITEQKLEEIKACYAESRAMRDIMELLTPFQITPVTAMKIYQHFGPACTDILRKSPFRLCEISGFGFRRVDTIIRKSGGDPHDPVRIHGAMICALENARQHGHLYLEVNALITESMQFLNEPIPLPQMQVRRAEVEQKLQQMAEDNEIVSDGGRLYLPHIFMQEVETAAKAAAMLMEHTAKIDVTLPLEQVKQKLGLHLTKRQSRGVEVTMERNLSIITGGPGTGKTTVLKAIIEVYRILHPKNRIVLAAPTGKASRRMAQSTGMLEALTLHSLLGLQGDFCSKDKQDKPLQVDFLIVDEASMVDMWLAHQLFTRLRRGTKLLLLGDVDQLESVGAGNVFAELIGSGIVPVTVLDEIFRQSKDSLIAYNAKFINEENSSLFYGPDFQFVKAENQEEAAAQIQTLYLRELQDTSIGQLQIISPYRTDGEASSNGLNALIRETVNPHTEKIPEFAFGERIFRLHDRVMQTKNNYNLEGYLHGVCEVSEIDACVEQWHKTQPDGVPLQAYLGLLGEEYHAFLQPGGNAQLKELLNAQRKQLGCRIYQLEFTDTEKTKPFAFSGIDALHKAGFQQPPASEYRLVRDEMLYCAKGEPDLAVLERVFDHYNGKLPADYPGRCVAPSDVLELYDAEKRRYYYRDMKQFVPVAFSPLLVRPMLPRAETDAADFLLSGRCAAAIKTISAE